MSIVVVFLAPLFNVGISALGEPQELSWAEVARRGRASTALLTLMVPSGQRMVGEASAFCVHSSGLFVTNHHAIYGILPVEIAGAIVQHPRDRNTPTPPILEHIPIMIPAEAKPRIKLILNSNRPEQKILLARVLWTDPDWDLALLRVERASELPALPIALEQDLANLREVAVFGFPLGSAMAIGQSFPAVNVNRGKVLEVAAKDGKPEAIVADLSTSPGNSGGPLLDKRGQVVGVISARLENRANRKGVSLAIPVNRLEWFLSKPEIMVAPRVIARAAAGKPVEFKAELKMLFPPRDPVEIELILGSTSGKDRRFPMTCSAAGYRATAVPFSAPKVKPGVSLTLMNDPDPLTGRVNAVLTHGSSPGKRLDFGLADVRRIRVRPTLVLEGAFATGPTGPKTSRLIDGPVAGIGKVLAELERQLPNLDPEEVDEIEVKPVSVELSIPSQRGPVICLVEDRWLSCEEKALRLSDFRRIRLRPPLEADAVVDHRDLPPWRVASLKGPVGGFDEVLAELTRRIANFDPKQVDEIQVKPVATECILTVWQVGTTVAKATCDDRDLKVGAHTFRLSNARRLRPGKFPQVELAHQERFEGPIVGLDGLLAEIKRRMPKVDPKVVTKILVNPQEASDTDTDTVRCTLVARRAGTIVGRLQTEIYAEDPAQPSLETLSRGQFIRPHRSQSPVTSLRLRIPEDDGLGHCDRKDLVDEFRRCLTNTPAASGRKQTFLFEGEKPLFTRFSRDGGYELDSVSIQHRYSSWRIGFGLPLGQTFEPGEYVIIADDRPGTPRSPIATGARNFSTDASKWIRYDGRIRVWELVKAGDGLVKRLAMDFVLRYKTKGQKPDAGGDQVVVGMYRWRSTFQ